MKRHVIYPGANARLVATLQKRFEEAKADIEELEIQVGGIVYAGPVKRQAGNENWHIKRTALAPKKSEAPKKSAPKKAAPKKSAPAKQAKRSKAKS